MQQKIDRGEMRQPSQSQGDLEDKEGETTVHGDGSSFLASREVTLHYLGGLEEFTAVLNAIDNVHLQEVRESSYSEDT